MIDMIEDPGTELVPAAERAALALQSSKTEQHLRTLATKHASITQVVDKAGREQAHGAARELTRARTAVVNAAKEARDDATKFSKAVIAEANRLVAIVEPEEIRLKEVRDAWDAEQARIKREAEEKERARVLAITERISEIKSFYALAMQCRTAERVKSLIDKLAAYDLSGFDEFDGEAAQAHADTMKAMGDHFAALTEREAEAARIKAEREAEAARIKAEREELARQQAEAKRQADERAAALRAQQAEVVRQQAEFAEQQAAAERKAREAAEQEERRHAHAARVEADRIAREQAEAVSAAHIPAPVDPMFAAISFSEAEPAPEVFTGPDLVDTAIDPPPFVRTLAQAKPVILAEPPSAQELIDEISRLYMVDQATAARWLAVRADEFKAIAAKTETA